MSFLVSFLPTVLPTGSESEQRAARFLYAGAAAAEPTAASVSATKSERTCGSRSDRVDVKASAVIYSSSGVRRTPARLHGLSRS